MIETRTYPMAISVFGHLFFAALIIGLQFVALRLFVWHVAHDDFLRGVGVGFFIANAFGTLLFSVTMIRKDCKMEYRP